MKYTAENIMVYPINTKKLSDDIINPKQSTKLRLNGKLGLIKVPLPAIIDDEFVGQDIGDKAVFYLYADNLNEKGEVVSYDCLPSSIINIPLASLEEYLEFDLGSNALKSLV